MTRWWKCDLQVATPAWNFTHDEGMVHDLSSAGGRAAFASDYMAAAKARGLDVLALADHNTGEWIDLMVEAGKSAGVVVFPGCEITTGSGADGIHLLVIGDRAKTSQDFDRLLSGPIGFSEDSHPRFHDVDGKRVPGSSGKTIEQILDELPESYLVVAPHALNDNGIASKQSAKGDIRYKALHHPRLVAVDAGDCSDSDTTSWNAKFKNRALDHIPRIKSIAFVATSDAYSLAALGKRYCWIRMEEPTLEALRQAFLDFDARILCDWDARLDAFPDRDPNNVRHPWIARVSLSNLFGGSTESLELVLHPSLNVFVGGRGSGKSTVVAAIRQMYAGYESLPTSVRLEAKDFATIAFTGSMLSAEHRVAASQETQSVSWNGMPGSDVRAVDSRGLPTSFRVRVVSQKELYARVMTDPSDPSASSRSLLAFVDESLGLRPDDKALPGTWSRLRQDAAAAWAAAARRHERLRVDIEQLPAVQADVETLQRQIESFDSEDARSRRESFERFEQQQRVLTQERERVAELLLRVRSVADATDSRPNLQIAQPDPIGILAELRGLEDEIRTELRRIAVNGDNRASEWDRALEASEWQKGASDAAADRTSYLNELAEQGLKPEEYVELRSRLDEARKRESALVGRVGEVAAAERAVHAAWEDLRSIVEDRKARRQELFDRVQAQSGRLRFVVRSHADRSGWVAAVRTLLNLRADGFVEDVPILADWLFEEGMQSDRFQVWREGLAQGDLSRLASKSRSIFRPAWQKRLEELDEAIRLRLATELADDVVEMSFLRDGGTASLEASWQAITRGSPGQRTAAMLAFVLHHGDEPLILDQPEDDLDTEWLTGLVIRELRSSRWRRQLVIVSHNANIPVNGDAERVIVLENSDGSLRVRCSSDGHGGTQLHCGAIEVQAVRQDIQKIMEGGVVAFQKREQRYNLESPAY